MTKKIWSNPEFCNLGIENTLGDPNSSTGSDDVWVDGTVTFTYKGQKYTNTFPIELGKSN